MEETPEIPEEKSGPESMVGRLRSLLSEHKAQGDRPRRVQVIINPAAGKDQPILKSLNATMQAAGADWDVSITKNPGDGRRLAEEAVKAGIDLVLAHGGDGTVMEVATGLMGSGIPLAIIPGGTANVMAAELGIPGDLLEACALAINPAATLRAIDMGKVDDHYFMLRVGMGFEAAMVEGADRELKDRLGILAYALSGLQALSDPPIARYQLMLDGQEVATEGLTCIIANSGSIGVSGILLAPTINISDGLLDVIVVTRADLPSLLSVAASVVGGNENSTALQHWQVNRATVVADPPQMVQVDGEILSQTPVTVEVIPQAVQVIVPQKGEVPGEVKAAP